MYRTSGGARRKKKSLPPKSGLNRMSYPFISLSTVSFTKGILLGSFKSLTLRSRKEKKVQNEQIQIKHDVQNDTCKIKCKTAKSKLTFEPKWRSTVGKKSKSQRGFPWSSPSQQCFRWLLDASKESAHPTYSRRCRGANEGRMRVASPRSKSRERWWWMSRFHCRGKY